MLYCAFSFLKLPVNSTGIKKKGIIEIPLLIESALLGSEKGDGGFQCNLSLLFSEKINRFTQNDGIIRASDWLTASTTLGRGPRVCQHECERLVITQLQTFPDYDSLPPFLFLSQAAWIC